MDSFITVATLAAAVGYIANQVVELVKPVIKNRVPDEQRNAASRLFSLLVTGGLALVAGYGAEAMGFIAPGGAWLVFGAVFPATGVWFQADSRRKSAKEASRNYGETLLEVEETGNG